MREEVALKINLPESRVQVSVRRKYLNPTLLSWQGNNYRAWTTQMNNWNATFSSRCGSKTDEPSIASRPSKPKVGRRTKRSAGPWRRKALPSERPAQRAGPVDSSRRRPAPPSRLWAAALRPSPSGARPPSPRSLTRCLPPPPACSAPTPWPTPKRRGTTRATRAPLPTSPGWTAAPTSRLCTTSYQPRAPPWAPWAPTGCPATPRPPSPPRRTERRGSASAAPQTAWTIRSKLPPRGSSISTRTVWITKTKQRGNFKCCERRELKGQSPLTETRGLDSSSVCQPDVSLVGLTYWTLRLTSPQLWSRTRNRFVDQKEKKGQESERPEPYLVEFEE